MEKVDITPAWPSDQKIRERRRSGRAGILDDALKDVRPEEEEAIPAKGAVSSAVRDNIARVGSLGDAILEYHQVRGFHT